MIPTLKPYQEFSKEFIKNRLFAGLFLDMGLGKAIDDNTIIPTTKGQKRVGDIMVGDKLYDRKGKPTTVTAIYPHKNKNAYKVTLKDGRSFICCDEHLIPYYSYSKAKHIKVKPLKDMLDDYKHTTSQNSTKYNYRIPKNEAVEFDEKDHFIDPYVIGVLIGDGLMRETSLAISSNEPDVVHKTAELLDIPKEHIKKRTSNYTWAFTKHQNLKPIQKELIRLKLRHTNSHTKFIPDEYIYDSIENRMSLLKGLMDTDGCVNISHKGAIHYSYSTMNPHLAEQIRQVCLSLGFGVSVNDYQYNGVRHDISIRIFTSETIVSSKKHLEKLEKGTHKSIQDKMTPIVNIEQVESRDMTCFTVDNDEHLYLINDYIVTHNTLITLTALVELAQERKISGHILIVAPVNIAINTWPDEIEKWDHTRKARFTLLSGLSKPKREEALKAIDGPAQIWITNPESIPTLVDQYKNNWPWKNVIIDEVQRFKSYSAKRFKAIHKVRPQITRVIGLTGTPAPNSLMDLWPEITLLDGGKRLGKNITAYRDTYFNPGRKTPEGYPYEWLPKENAEQKIYDKISDIVVSMKASDYLDMPEITYNDVMVSMTKKEKRVYEELKKEHVLPVLDKDGNQSEVTAANAAVLSAKLLQLSNGAIYTDSENKSKDIAVLHDHKLKAFEQIIESSQGQPILLFYWFQHDIKRLQVYFKDLITKFDGSPEMVKKWNRGEIQVLAAHPASAGFGLNLQAGGHIITWFSLPNFNLELYKQANARLFRQGQTKPVIVHHILCKGTVDANVIGSLGIKEANQDRLMDAVNVIDIISDMMK